MSLVLHAAGFGAACFVAAPSFLAPSFHVESGRTTIELAATIESVAPEKQQPIPRVKVGVEASEDVQKPEAARLAEALRREFAEPVAPTALAQAPTPQIPSQTASTQPSRRRETETPPPAEAVPQRRQKTTATPPPPEMAAVASAASAASQQASGTQVDELPQLLPNNPLPTYAGEVNQAGLTGVVKLRVTVGINGRPTRVDIEETSGFVPWDHSAQRTVRDFWRFRPAYRGREPVEYTIDLPIRFRIGGSK